MPEYLANNRGIMLDMTTKTYKTDLRSLQFNPESNPLIDASGIALSKKRVRSSLQSKTLIDADTGEVTATSVIHQVEEKDDEHFVKIFAAGIAAAYELKAAGKRVFQAVLHEYEQSPMSRGYVDVVYLAWFDGGLSGRDIGMSEYTFNRGLRELLDKEFLSPRSPSQFWVNPALFFKGDRAIFVKEFRRKSKVKTEQDKLEEQGQQRLLED